MEEPENNKVNTKSESDLFARSVKGGLWVFAIRILTQVLSVGRYIILMNFLAVSDMGLLGVALLLMQTLNTFTDTGFNAALIQKNKSLTSYLNTAWTVGIIRAFVLFMILYTSAPYLATWKVPLEKVSLTVWVIRVSGLSFFVSALSNSGTIHFRKELQFNKQFVMDVIPTFISIAITIILVFIYKSVWSLVLGRLSASIAKCTISYIIHPFRPRLSLDLEKAKELWVFGKWVFGAAIVGFLLTQGDDFFVWGYLGYTALGLYQAAYKFSNIPATEITHVISQVTFPAYSKLQNDIPRLREAYLKVLKMSASLSIPIAGLIFILTPEFVKLFLKPDWLPIIPAMQILAICGLLRSLGATTGPVFLAVGRPDITPKAALAMLSFLVIIIYPLTKKWGIAGTSLAVLAATIFVQPIAQYFIVRILRYSFLKLNGVIIGPLVASAVAVGVVLLTKIFLPVENIAMFIVVSIEFAIAYLAVLLSVDRIFGCDIIKTAREQLAALANR